MSAASSARDRAYGENVAMTDDYRRGRAALGFLSGTRPNPPVSARRRRLRRLGPAAALVVIAASSTVIVGSSLNHTSRPVATSNVSGAGPIADFG